MNGLDLFAGSGIGSLAFKYTIPDYRSICYIENDPYCQAVLVTRIKDGLLEDAPIWDDVRTFDGRRWRGKVDIISAGFPCQPFSVAGQRKGDADERNLWPDTVRIIGEVRPQYALLENVPGLISSGYFEAILCDLAKIGYNCEWDIVSAAFVGAPHLRKRLWMLAWDTNGRDGNERTISRMAEGEKTEPAGICDNVADTDRTREPQSQGIKQDERRWFGDKSENGICNTVSMGLSGESRRRTRPESQNRCWWTVEPNMGRVAHGVAFRVDRLKMLGNGWVPQVVARILRMKVGVDGI